MLTKLTFLLLLSIPTISIKLNIKDIMASNGWGNGNGNNLSSWGNNNNGNGNGHSNNGSVDLNHHLYSLETSVGDLNGFSAVDVLAGYIKQLVMTLSSSENEILVVRLEKDKQKGEVFKILYRIRLANGDCIYIGIVFRASCGELEILKFFQSDVLDEIIDTLQFCQNKVFKYPDGNLSSNNQCGNSILNILTGFCDALGNNGNGHGNGWNNGNGNGNGHGLQVLDNCDGSGNCDNNGNSWGNGNGNGNGGSWGNGNGNSSSWGNGNGNGNGNGAIKINVKIPGSKNPSGKDILLGSKAP